MDILVFFQKVSITPWIKTRNKVYTIGKLNIKASISENVCLIHKYEQKPKGLVNKEGCQAETNLAVECQ